MFHLQRTGDEWQNRKPCLYFISSFLRGWDCVLLHDFNSLSEGLFAVVLNLSLELGEQGSQAATAPPGQRSRSENRPCRDPKCQVPEQRPVAGNPALGHLDNPHRDHGRDDKSTLHNKTRAKCQNTAYKENLVRTKAVHCCVSPACCTISTRFLAHT